MIRRTIYLGVLAAVLVVGDLATRSLVESTVNERARVEAPPGSTVNASIEGFPFVPKLVLNGEVSAVDVHITNVSTGLLVLAEVDVSLDGVHLDRGRLINDRKARITDIDRGTVGATITEEALQEALKGTPVAMTPGKLVIAGIDVTPTTTDNRLRLGRLTLPTTGYVPCVTGFEIQRARMRLSCEIEKVPPALLDAVEEALHR